MTKYPKKHTRKNPCAYCGANCGSNHKPNCKAIKFLERQGRGYKVECETLSDLTITKYKEYLKAFNNGDKSIFKNINELNYAFNKAYAISCLLSNNYN